MSLLTDLVAHWRLNETSGSRPDSHGSFSLSESSGVGYASGKIGNAASFPDTETGYLYRESIDGTDLELANADFTLAFWAKVASTGGMLCGWRGSLYDCVIGTRAAEGDLVVGVSGTDYETETTFSTGSWHFVVITYTASSGTLRVYQDNSLLIAPTVSTAPGSESAFIVGDDFSFEGDRYLDSVSYWKRVLSSNERTDLWNGGTGLDYPDFVPAVALSGSASAAATATGTLTATAPPAALAGTVESQAGVYGSLAVTIPPVSLAGSCPAQSSLYGNLTVTVPAVGLDGAAAAQASLYGNLTVTVPVVGLDGAAAAQASLYGNLTVTVPAVGLDGAAAAQASLYGNLTVTAPVVGLDGAATAQASTVGSLTVTVPDVLLDGSAIASALATGRLIVALPIEVMKIWSGEITSVSFDGPFIRAVAKGLYALFDQAIPRWVIQPQCNHTVYDAGCGLSRANWTFTAVAVSGSGNGITLGTFARSGGLPSGWGFANYFALGYIERLTGERLPILASSALSSGEITMTLDRLPADAWAVAEAVSIVPGCDGRRETCQVYGVTLNPEGKFNNYPRFLGTPFVPAKNPAFSVPKRTDSAAGKK